MKKVGQISRKILSCIALSLAKGCVLAKKEKQNDRIPVQL